MQFKIRAFDGNLERKVIKVIRVKLSLDQNLLDMFKVTTQFKQHFFYKDGSIYIKGQDVSNHIVLW